MSIRPLFITFALLSLPALALAQTGRLQLPDFSQLERQASDSTTVTIEPWLLSLAIHFVHDDNADAAHLKDLLHRISHVYVHSFEFAGNHSYSMSDIDSLRQQLRSPEWQRLVQTHSSKEQEDVDIFLAVQDSRTKGLAIIVTEPHELTVVNIVGDISIDDLPKLGAHLGIPNIAAAKAEPQASNLSD